MKILAWIILACFIGWSFCMTLLAIGALLADLALLAFYVNQGWIWKHR